ncbi:hypothetical protein ABW19_dt0204284 [Dactylella cylindrospora]|nr:hypothetical protein ABW19_dt0204284 [Dactylella cylindrospora]
MHTSQPADSILIDSQFDDILLRDTGQQLKYFSGDTMSPSNGVSAPQLQNHNLYKRAQHTADWDTIKRFVTDPAYAGAHWMLPGVKATVEFAKDYDLIHKDLGLVDEVAAQVAAISSIETADSSPSVKLAVTRYIGALKDYPNMKESLFLIVQNLSKANGEAWDELSMVKFLLTITDTNFNTISDDWLGYLITFFTEAEELIPEWIGNVDRAYNELQDTIQITGTSQLSEEVTAIQAKLKDLFQRFELLAVLANTASKNLDEFRKELLLELDPGINEQDEEGDEEFLGPNDSEADDFNTLFSPSTDATSQSQSGLANPLSQDSNNEEQSGLVSLLGSPKIQGDPSSNYRRW